MMKVWIAELEDDDGYTTIHGVFVTKKAAMESLDINYPYTFWRKKVEEYEVIE